MSHSDEDSEEDEDAEEEEEEEGDDRDWETKLDDSRLEEESERARAAFSGMRVSEEEKPTNERLNVRNLVATANPNVNPKAAAAANSATVSEENEEEGDVIVHDPYGAFDPTSRSSMSKQDREELERKEEGNI